MKIETQLCSVELAKKLHGLGVNEDSHFYWLHSQRQGWFVTDNVVSILKDESGFLEEVYNAYSVAELGEILPSGVILEGLHYYEYQYEFRQCLKGKVGFRVWYENPKDSDDYNHVLEADTEANARAKMLIYLLENKLLTPSHPIEEANK